jgi:hypothetical protein
MASVLMHAMVGVFVGLAAGVRLRYWPALAVLGEWMDLDHIFSEPGGPVSPVWMAPRATFHNVILVFVVPAVLGAWAYYRRVGRPDLRRIATALPAVMGAHFVFDFVDVASGDAGWVYAFYPFSLQRTGIGVSRIAGDPSYIGSNAIGLALAFGLALLAGVLTRAIGLDEDREIRKARTAVYLATFALAAPFAVLVLGRPIA